jgi:SAM-dependent methyltransferase
MKRQKEWRQSKYTRNSNDRLIASRDTSEVALSSRFVADLTAAWYDENLKIYCKGDLLDLGCGKAPLFGTYNRLVNSVTLADWENSLHENIHLDVACDITKKLPFKDNSFDTIILSDVLEHTPNPNDIFAELKRILRPKGYLLLNSPFAYPLHEIPYDYGRYTEYLLAKIAKDNKLNVVQISVLAGGWGVLIDLLSKLFINRPKVVSLLQNYGPRLLNSRIHQRSEYPLAYAAVFKNERKS